MHNAEGCIDKTNKPQSPIKRGWRGDLNGFVQNTNGTQILVSGLLLNWTYTPAMHSQTILQTKANSVEGGTIKSRLRSWASH